MERITGRKEEKTRLSGGDRKKKKCYTFNRGRQTRCRKKDTRKKEKEKVCEKNRGETGGNESLVEQAERSQISAL